MWYEAPIQVNGLTHMMLEVILFTIMLVVINRSKKVKVNGSKKQLYNILTEIEIYVNI